MRLLITESEDYPNDEIEIPDWIAKNKEILNRFKSRVSIIRETEKAYCISFREKDEELWVPKSQCEIRERREETLSKYGID